MSVELPHFQPLRLKKNLSDQFLMKTFILWLILFSELASGAIFTVTNSNDSGAGSLRQAVLDANATGTANTINFNTGRHFSVARTITLTSGELVITSPITITGPVPLIQRVSISGNDASRVMSTQSVGAANVTMRNLTIRNGSVSGFGAGIQFSDGSATLTMENSTVLDCAALGTSLIPSGGGLSASGGTLILNNCKLISNSSMGLWGRVGSQGRAG